MIAALPLPVRKSLRIFFNVYPPIALIIAAFVMASGCASTEPTTRPTTETAGVRTDMIAPTTQPAAQLAAARVLPTYPTQLPVIGHAAARAITLHGDNRVDIINLGQDPWPAGTIVWLNGRYGAQLPLIQPGTFTEIDFVSLRDSQGVGFPHNNNLVQIDKVELELAGELTNVRFDLSY